MLSFRLTSVCGADALVQIDTQITTCVLNTNSINVLAYVDDIARIVHMALPLLLTLYKAWEHHRKVRRLTNPESDMINLDPNGPMAVTNGTIDVLVRDTTFYVIWYV